MNSSELLERYGAMRDLSQQMLESAEHGEWDRLVELSNARSAIVEELTLQDKISWNGTAALRKEEFIRAILADDAEVKVLTQSRMKKLQETLESIGVEKKLKKAYEV